MLGGALTAGAIVLAPYVLPALGLESSSLTKQIFSVVCGTDPNGTGIAGGLNNLYKSIPFAGEYIASGGYSTAAVSGIIGLGGTLLGKRIEKNHEGKGINWGKVIITAALTTSLLISLPSLLTGISMGIGFIAFAMNPEMGQKAVDFLSTSIGSIGQTAANNSGITGGMALIPHLITCGASFFPAAASYFMAEKDEGDPTKATQQAALLAPNIANHNYLATSPETLTTTALSHNIRAYITTATPPQAGKPCHATITLTHANDGSPLSAEEIAVTHTEKLHLLLIDSSMKDYQHLHPQPTQQNGVFSFSYTPRTDNPMSAWVDFTLKENLLNPQIKLSMPSTSPPVLTAPAQIIHNDRAVLDSLTFHWHEEKPLRQGESAIIELAITDRDGHAVQDLEPIMGAYCHLVGFSANGEYLIHSHPIGKEPTSQDDRGEGMLRFHISPERTGDIQFFAQIKRQGEVIYVPFGQYISPGSPQTTQAKPTMMISHMSGTSPIQMPHTHSVAR